MSKLTLRGVFFLARSSVRLNIWALCQQTQLETHFYKFRIVIFEKAGRTRRPAFR